jgi:hypothetical protein
VDDGVAKTVAFVRGPNRPPKCPSRNDARSRLDRANRGAKLIEIRPIRHEFSRLVRGTNWKKTSSM